MLTHIWYSGPRRAEQTMCLKVVVQNRAELLHLEKEGLSCVFGVKRFHPYLFDYHKGTNFRGVEFSRFRGNGINA